MISARRLLLTIPVAAALVVPALPAAGAGTSDLFAGFQTDSKDPVNVDAAALEVFEEGNQRVSVFSGGVTVKRGATTLKAGSIKLYSSLDTKASKTGAFTRIEALGKVFVSSGPQTVTGQKAVVDMASQVITLTGNVVLSQGTSVMTGEKLVVDLRTGRAKLEQAPGKRIQGVITPDTIKAATPDGSAPAAP